MANVPNLKMRITVEDDLPAALERDSALLKKHQSEVNAGAEKAEKAKTSIKKEGEKERLAVAKAADATADKMALDRARAQYKIDQAEASARSNLFERQRRGEQALTTFNEAQLRIRVKDQAFSNELIEQERLRHEVKMIAIAKREAEYSSQPFQKLLTELATLSGLGGFKAKAAEGLEGFMEHGVAHHPVDDMKMLAGGGQHEVAAGAASAERAVAGEAAAVGGLSGGMGHLGAATLGVTAAIGILGLAIEHTAEIAKEDRLAEEQLAQALKNSGRAIPIGLMDEYAESLSKTTRNSKEMAQSAEAVLLGVRGLASTELPKLLKLSADLAASPAFNGTVKDAAILLGKAFEEPEKGARALRAAGAVLSDAELLLIKNFEDSGEKAKAQGFIFDTLTQKTKDFATETTHSTDIAGNAWHEYEGEFGKVALRVGDWFAKMSGFGSQYQKDLDAVLEDVQKKGEEEGHGFVRILLDRMSARDKYLYEDAGARHAHAELIRHDDEREAQRVLQAADKSVGVLKNRTEKQQEIYDQYQSDLTAATEAGEDVRLGAIKDAEKRAEAQENKRYRDDKNRKIADTQGQELAEKAHIQNLRNIRAEAAQKETTKDEETAKNLAAKGLEYRAKEIEELRKYQRDIAAARSVSSGLAGRESALDPNDPEKAREALREKQAAEKEALQDQVDNQSLSLQARAMYQLQLDRMDKIHAQETIKLDRDIATAKKQVNHQIQDNYLATFGVMNQLVEEFAGKSKASFLVTKGLAAAEIAVNTARAYTAALAPPPMGLGPVLGIPLATSIGVLGGAQEALVLATTIKGFEAGGWTGGREGQPVGIVHGQERVVSAPEVRAMGGPAAVDRALSGGGGDIYHVSVVVPAGTTPSDGQRIGYAIGDGLRKSVRNQDLRTRQGVRIRQQV